MSNNNMPKKQDSSKGKSNNFSQLVVLTLSSGIAAALVLVSILTIIFHKDDQGNVLGASFDAQIIGSQDNGTYTGIDNYNGTQTKISANEKITYENVTSLPENINAIAIVSGTELILFNEDGAKKIDDLPESASFYSSKLALIQPEFSPDGQLLVYNKEDSVYLYNIEKSEKEIIYKAIPNASQLDKVAPSFHFAWLDKENLLITDGYSDSSESGYSLYNVMIFNCISQQSTFWGEIIADSPKAYDYAMDVLFPLVNCITLENTPIQRLYVYDGTLFANVLKDGDFKWYAVEQGKSSVQLDEKMAQDLLPKQTTKYDVTLIHSQPVVIDSLSKESTVNIFEVYPLIIQENTSVISYSGRDIFSEDAYWIGNLHAVEIDGKVTVFYTEVKNPRALLNAIESGVPENRLVQYLPKTYVKYIQLDTGTVGVIGEGEFFSVDIAD